MGKKNVKVKPLQILSQIVSSTLLNGEISDPFDPEDHLR
jgi:hypothetical protein